MKANELRINNWVYWNSDNDFYTPFLIEDFKELKYFDLFKPIPLTEEWLLKFGFKEDIGEPERFFNDFISLTKYGIHRVIEYNGFDFTITYAHELQNLYFALTKTELQWQNLEN
jgi:hypothetical protein